MKKTAVIVALTIFQTPFTHADGISEETLVARMDAIYSFCEKHDPVMKGLASAIAKKMEGASPGTMAEEKRIRNKKTYANELAEQKKELQLEPINKIELKCRQLFESSK